MPNIGNKLGEIAGKRLITTPAYQTIDVIIPVPLHPRKLKQRGYNQSAQFAQGLAERMNKPVNVESLVRLKHTQTQTKRSRFSRFENMQHVFSVKHPERLEGKHVLLVDDIITPLILTPALKAVGASNIGELHYGAIKYGNFLSAVIKFIVIALALFSIIKMINSMKRKEEAAAPPAPSSTDQLLMQIRDSLKK